MERYGRPKSAEAEETLMMRAGVWLRNWGRRTRVISVGKRRLILMNICESEGLRSCKG